MATKFGLKLIIMKIKLLLFVSLFALFSIALNAQDRVIDPPERKHFIGSNMFMIMTPLLDPSPKYYQLNYGYRLTPKDVLSIEAITWTYLGPLGRPYGPDYEQERSNYPGSVRSLGGGLAYKRFLWKQLYVQIHATAFHQKYADENDKKIQTGFQLFNVLRMGYQLRLFKQRIFIEPSVACTSWPINTNLPDDFLVEENKWPKYFLFEPGLHFGINF